MILSNHLIVFFIDVLMELVFKLQLVKQKNKQIFPGTGSKVFLLYIMHSSFSFKEAFSSVWNTFFLIQLIIIVIIIIIIGGEKANLVPPLSVLEDVEREEFVATKINSIVTRRGMYICMYCIGFGCNDVETI